MTEIRKVWTLVNSNSSFCRGWIRKLELLGFSQIELRYLENVDEEAMLVEKEAKNQYYNEEKFKYNKELVKFEEEIKNENGEEWIKDRRLEYLKSKFDKLNKRIAAINRYYKDATEREVPQWIKSVLVDYEGLNNLIKERKRVDIQVHFTNHSDKINEGWVTKEQIALAENYPFEKLVGTNKLKIPCPFHNETAPSFYIKNNWGYCFGCNWTGNTIKFLMKREGIGFVEAVKKLQI